MAEWLKAAVLKTVDAYGIRGFESLSLCKYRYYIDFLNLQMTNTLFNTRTLFSHNR